MFNIKNMRKSLFVILVFFVAASCKETAIYQDKVNDLQNFHDFQESVNLVFSKATDNIDTIFEFDHNQTSIGLLVREAYIEVFGEANMHEFEQAREQTLSGNRSKSDQIKYLKSDQLSISIIQNTDSHHETLELITESLSNKDLSDHERIELIISKEFIKFLSINHQAIEKNLFSSLIAESNEGDNGSEEEADTEIQEEDESWWDSWGRCAAGIVGGCGTVGGSFCLAAAAITAGPGCIPAGAFGCISGGLSGAAAAC